MRNSTVFIPARLVSDPDLDGPLSYRIQVAAAVCAGCPTNRRIVVGATVVGFGHVIGERMEKISGFSVNCIFKGIFFNILSTNFFLSLELHL